MRQGTGNRGRFPTTRLRRNRQHAWLRSMVAETKLAPSDLIWPLFVHELEESEPVAAMLAAAGSTERANDEISRHIHDVFGKGLGRLPDGVGDGDWYMDYRNADGSVAQMCGNGVRCLQQSAAAWEQRSSESDRSTAAAARPARTNERQEGKETFTGGC